MMPLEEPGATIDPRIAYRVGRVAFFLAAVAMALSAVSHLCVIATILSRGGPIRWLIRSPAWDWMVITPATFAGFFASFLLLGRGRESSWVRRSILFALIEAYLVAYWCLDHRELFGQPPMMRRLDMTREVALGSLRFVAILTLGSLAFDMLRRLGRGELEGQLRMARGASGLGLMLLSMLALRLYDRGQAWPPRFAPIGDIDSLNLFIGLMMARCAAGAFVGALCARACAACSRELDRIQRAMIEDDPFRSPSERSR